MFSAITMVMKSSCLWNPKVRMPSRMNRKIICLLVYLFNKCTNVSKAKYLTQLRSMHPAVCRPLLSSAPFNCATVGSARALRGCRSRANLIILPKKKSQPPNLPSNWRPSSGRTSGFLASQLSDDLLVGGCYRLVDSILEAIQIYPKTIS